MNFCRKSSSLNMSKLKKVKLNWRRSKIPFLLYFVNTVLIQYDSNVILQLNDIENPNANHLTLEETTLSRSKFAETISAHRVLSKTCTYKQINIILHIHKYIVHTYICSFWSLRTHEYLFYSLPYVFNST